MSGFQSPNFTQVPNDFFDEMLPELEKAELKVLLVVIRGTFGYHRNEVKISTREMAELTGLSAASIEPATKSLESMGLIEKVVDGNKTASWRAVVSVPTIGTRKQKGVPTIGTQAPQPLVRDVPVIDTLSGLNKDKQTINKIGDESPDEPALPLPLDWQIAMGSAITMTDVDSEFRATVEIACMAICHHGADLEPLARAFMLARKLTPTKKAVKGWASALREMKAQKVTPEIITLSVQELAAKNYTIADPFSIAKTAISKANPVKVPEVLPDYMQNYFGS